MIPSDPGVVAAALANAVEDALACWATTLDPPGDPVSRAGMVPGASVAADDCCGQVTVTFTRAYRTTSFPDESNDATRVPFGGSVAADFDVQLLRCVPGITEGGMPPTAEALAASASALAAEAVVMWAAVSGYLEGTFDDDEFVLGALSAVGPDGRCAGYTVPVTVDLGSLCAPPSCD